nr:MAG TPA: hypothetical protein [Caudoviricetes sp.]
MNRKKPVLLSIHISPTKEVINVETHIKVPERPRLSKCTHVINGCPAYKSENGWICFKSKINGMDPLLRALVSNR